jgi:hypothetical protein
VWRSAGLRLLQHQLADRLVVVEEDVTGKSQSLSQQKHALSTSTTTQQQSHSVSWSRRRDEEEKNSDDAWLRAAVASESKLSTFAKLRHWLDASGQLISLSYDYSRAFFFFFLFFFFFFFFFFFSFFFFFFFFFLFFFFFFFFFFFSFKKSMEAWLHEARPTFFEPNVFACVVCVV